MDLPPRVEAAVALARAAGFPCSCRPGQGELLRTVVAGRPSAVIGETGTGYGVGLATQVTVDPTAVTVLATYVPDGIGQRHGQPVV